MRLAAAASAIVAGLIMALNPVSANVSLLSFDDLNGWTDDDHSAALAVFRETCQDMDDPEWANLCAYATSDPDPRDFFELFFKPVLIGDPEEALFTGYFEPELDGSLTKDDTYKYPVYRMPPDVIQGEQWFSRREIETQGLLEDQGLEIAYISDPVDVFFLQIQGSGRIKLQDGGALRVGYGGKNGHEYKSVGQELARRGVFQPHEVSARVIQNWVRNNPEEGAELLRTNPSFVFFREVNEVPQEKGPLGAMNRSITELRSIAVDPAYVTLGAPVWIEKAGKSKLHRLMIAQDTGSAIKGPQRADVFYGTGQKAGLTAGAIKDTGRIVVLLPIQLAYALVPGE